MNKSLHKLLPVLFGFFVMGFCDVVGISTSYVQQDFGLSETLAGFIPSMVFIWFLLLSIPAALAMNRLGRKNMVQISNGITAIGMLIPFVHYNLATCMTAFVLLGIGNTILQVSLNPLLTNVVKGGRADQFADRRPGRQGGLVVLRPLHRRIRRRHAGQLAIPLPDLRAHHAALGRMAHVHPHPRRGRSAAGLACRCDVRPAERPHGTPPLPRDRLRRRRRRGDEYRSAQAADRTRRLPRRAGRTRVERLLRLPHGRCADRFDPAGAHERRALFPHPHLRGHRRHGRPLLRTGYRGNAGAGRTDRLRLLEHLLGDLLDGAEMPSGKKPTRFRG